MMSVALLARLSEHDRSELEEFATFLRALDGGPCSLTNPGFRAWVAQDPAYARRYLGLSVKLCRSAGWPEEWLCDPTAVVEGGANEQR